MDELFNAADESLWLALWVKIDEKKDHHPTCRFVPRRGRRVYHSGKMNDEMIFLKPLQSSNLKILINFHAGFRK